MNEDPRLIGATDDKGHSVPLSVRVPSSWSEKIDKLVKDILLPYRNSGQLIRDAILRHFEFLEKYQGGEGSTLANIKAMEDLIEENRRQQGFECVLSNLRERISYYSEKGAQSEILKCILKVLQYVESMPDGYWKNEFKARLNAEYGEIIGEAHKASLIPREE